MINSDLYNLINTYLYFGYIPTPKDCDIFEIQPSFVEHFQIEEASNFLSPMISKYSSKGEFHVLPISGGLDSRLILCELLNSTTADRIHLFTFGIPGSYDYEIPLMISKKLGIKLCRVNLNDVTLSTNKLITGITENNKWTYLFDSFYNRMVYEYFGKDVIYWSGFMGNNLAGEHLNWYSGTSWEVASHTYLLHERRCNAEQLFSDEYNPRESIIKQPISNYIPYIDQLDFIHRQPKCILPILRSPNDSYTQLFPLTTPEFMNYLMGLPIEQRLGEKFYKNFIIARCKLLDDIPVKRTYCLPLKYEGTYLMKIKRLYVNFLRLLFNNPSPMLNYYDFNYAFRAKSDLKSLIVENLNDLESRKILDWVDIGNLKIEFFEKKRPIHDVISTLVSLEIYLKYENL